MVASLLSPPVAKEIISQYADVLRLGSLRVNDEFIHWDVRAHTPAEARLENFSIALVAALRRSPELQGLADQVLHEGTVYWICKSLSINYALVEVLSLVKRRVGALCSIESWSGQGNVQLAEYGVSVEPGATLRVGISWGSKGNLVTCDPVTAEKRVLGTVSRVETEFMLPPDHGFRPEYQVEMELGKRPRTSYFASPFVCRPETTDFNEISLERLLVPTPLRRTMKLPLAAVSKGRHTVSLGMPMNDQPSPLLVQAVPHVRNQLSNFRNSSIRSCKPIMATSSVRQSIECTRPFGTPMFLDRSPVSPNGEVAHERLCDDEDGLIASEGMPFFGSQFGPKVFREDSFVAQPSVDSMGPTVSMAEDDIIVAL